MNCLAKFDAVGTISDLEELRALTREAAALAQQALAERDDWKRRYEHGTADIVSIREVSLDELAQLVLNKNERGQNARNGQADS